MRKSLSDILTQDARQKLAIAWKETKAAEDYAPLPAGDYIARIISAELINSSAKGTPGYKLAFRVLEGDHTGRQFWHDLWLTVAALPTTKRDLAKIGITTEEQLEKPVPFGIRCKVKVILRKDDNGKEFNGVRAFEMLGIDPPEVDPFAPTDVPEPTPTSSASVAMQPKGDAADVPF